MQVRIYTADNKAKDVDINAGTINEMRASGSQTLLKHLTKTVGTQLAAGTTLSGQLAANLGITPETSVSDALDAKGYIGPDGAQAATVGGDGSVTGRLVVQAILFDAVEKNLRDDLSGYSKMLMDNAAIKRSIDSTKWETPVLDFKRPGSARPQPVTQLSEPQRMLTLQAGLKANAIMGDSIGIEFSDQVSKLVTIDEVALSIKRMTDESNAARAMYQIMSLLNGDVDYGMTPLATAIGGAAQASVLDPAAGGGKLTQTAWVKWLWRNNLKRTITTVITDLEGALAIENRSGRPTVMGDNGTSKRIDTLADVINPRWPDKVDVIITQDPTWPAGTIVGFDKKYAYRHITSTALDYKATEDFAMRRSTKMRFDQGSMVERYMDDAWDILDFN